MYNQYVSYLQDQPLQKLTRKSPLYPKSKESSIQDPSNFPWIIMSKKFPKHEFVKLLVTWFLKSFVIMSKKIVHMCRFCYMLVCCYPRVLLRYLVRSFVPPGINCGSFLANLASLVFHH